MAIEYSLIDRSQKNSPKSNTKNSRTAEVNGKTLSISFSINKRVIEHNNRIFIAKNVDGERVRENITYVLLCAVGGVLLGTGLGAVSNQVLKRTSLV